MFYVAASVTVVLVVFVGFARTYYLKGYFHPAPLPALGHVHGLILSGWIVLFLVQAVLVALRRIDLHRQVGLRGAVLAGLVVWLGATIAIASARANFAAGNAGALAFLATPLADMLVFCVLAATGIYYRSRGDIHKRLMLLATISMLDAAFARWPLAIVTEGTRSFVAVDLFIVAALIHDAVTRRRLHPANIWGGLLIVVSQPMRLAIASTGTWLAFARALAG